MADEQVRRRLAAILAADVAGYSRLMGKDEVRTRKDFNENVSQIIDPAVSGHGGRIVKTTGDGLLVEFSSVVAAVRCAADIQVGMAARGRAVSEDRRMEFRIGVHLGDVIVEGKDIHGDGVNVAARLEGLAEPGGIRVSGMVRESVRNKLDLGFVDLGETLLKNIAEPVRMFRVELDGPSAGAYETTASEAMFRRPAVAVLPFEDLSGDADQEYFADGLTEDLITALSLWRSFPVIARNSTFAYKGASPDIREVGRELGARYVIEGSVRRAGQRIRVTAQLIDAETGHHAWAERFDRDISDIFDLQDELVQRIAATVAPEVERIEHRRAVETRPRNLDAWILVQRGMAELYRFTGEANARARESFEHALELDPQYTEAHVGIAWSYIRDHTSGVVTDPDETRCRALAAARRAVEFDRQDSYAHLVHGIVLQFVGEHDQCIAELELAISLNPNSANGHVSIGHELALNGRAEEAIAHLEKGLSLNPKDPRNHLFHAFMARAHLTARRYAEAERWARTALQWNPDAPMARKLLAASLGHLGRLDEARTELDTIERTRPGYLARPESWHSYRFAEDREHFHDGLRKAGWGD